ncbi:hypothetical protein [Lactobacillus gallinarum]|uniref:hypothetical protein n=1 Tax=Lactobacillus gallinarum TaxID=52242 RepID=UPI001958FB42|nr:hypothetical protein [Lactobacillus gallinarum]MBM6958756.1 hypothetical protein [Lactobacillus gallinarum]
MKGAQNEIKQKIYNQCTVALLAVAPVTGVVSLPKTNIVYAARQSVSGKIKVTQTYASYFANGKRHPVKKGKVLKYMVHLSTNRLIQAAIILVNCNTI